MKEPFPEALEKALTKAYIPPWFENSQELADEIVLGLAGTIVFVPKETFDAMVKELRALRAYKENCKAHHVTDDKCKLTPNCRLYHG